MLKKIVSEVCDTGTWYKVPDYKVMLVRDGAVSTDKKMIRSPEDVVQMFRSYLDGVDREHFCIAMLDRKSNLLGLNTISIGGLHSNIVHPREVFKPAMIIGCASIILCHNHPSGDPAPSREDIEITRRLIEAGDIMGISVLDHVIIGDPGHCSLKEKGLI